MDCLVTKLKSSVNDDNLLKLGEFRIKVKTNGLCGCNLPFDVIRSLSGNAIFSWSSSGSNKISSVNRTNGDNLYIDTNGKEETIVIDNKYDNGNYKCPLSFWGVANGKYQYIDMDFASLLPYIKNKDNITEVTLFTIDGSNSFPIIDISLLKGFNNFDKFYAQCFTGDFSDIKDNLSNLVVLNISNLTTKNIYMTGLERFDVTSIKSKVIQHIIANFTYNIGVDVDKCAGVSTLVELQVSHGLVKNATSIKRVTDANLGLAYFDCWDVVFSTDDYMDALASRNYERFNASGTFTYNSQQFTGRTYKNVEGKNLTINQLDNFLKAISQATWTSGGALTITGGSRTSASDSAVRTIQEQGITVTLPVSSSLMRSRTEEKWAIAYKDKTLVTYVPMNLSKVQIYPAYGVTVKKFNTEAEAQTYIISNRLVKTNA